MSELIPDVPPPSPEGIEVAPSPPNAATVYLGGLFFLALLTVFKLAGAIVLPIVLALMLKLFLQPIMRLLAKLHFPRMVAAFCTISALLIFFVLLGSLLSTPVAEWTSRLPTAVPKIQAQINTLSTPISSIERALNKAEVTSLSSDNKTVTVAVKGTTFADRVLAGTTLFAGGVIKTLLVLFFMLISGDTFLRRLVEILPRFRDKKQAVEISQQIEADISGYLLTITVMNLGIGIATCLIMAACGIEDPILWGSAAFLLNYVPILGTMIATALFALVGIISLSGSLVLLPAGLYFLAHLIESQLITPIVLARRFTLNPVLVVLALVFFYWMWGVAGAILATPLLAIGKIICDRVDRLKPLGHFMEG